MIFIDFDGTIVDVWRRYCYAFCCANEIKNIDITEYITIKKSLKSDSKVAEYFGVDLHPDYFIRKKELLEDENVLKNDTLLIDSSALCRFFEDYDCRILTMRRNAENFFKQLEQLNLGCLAQKSVILDPRANTQKLDFLLKNYASGQHSIIGDSEAEWIAGSAPNVTSYLVQTGLRDPFDFVPHYEGVVFPSLNDWIKYYIKTK